MPLIAPFTCSPDRSSFKNLNEIRVQLMPCMCSCAAEKSFCSESIAIFLVVLSLSWQKSTCGSIYNCSKSKKKNVGQSAWFVHTPPSLRLATPSVYPPIRDQLSPESHVLNIVLRPDCQQVRSPLIALSLVTFLTSTCLGKSY